MRASSNVAVNPQIDALADEFERAMKASESPRIEDFLNRVAESVRPAALRELLNVEIELRRGSHELISAEEYLERFSSYEQVVQDACRQSDVALATAVGEQADPDTCSHSSSDKGSGRLEVRCPNCHAPTEVAADTTLTDLTCGACGSHFSLVDQSKVTRMAPPLTKMGRFDLIERLGVGGFGSVWKARDKELDRTVAIKIPRAGGMTGEEQEKFFREARAAAQLRHPSIVSVHEVGRDGDSVYIVSDFVRGVTLGDWLTGQKLTSREAAELCAKIAGALHHAHEQGVVHRDLKPANIMMDYDGQPHLMDFGLARRETGEVTVTMDGQIMGTPAYMSPEQAQGEAHTADGRSDLYSLGVILFQLLTGELPFRGNARMLIKQVIHDEPPGPRKLNANIRPDLETITLKCLEKVPAKRYPTAREFGEDLTRFLRNEPILARPVGTIGKTLRWAKRKPAIATFALLLFASTAVSSWLAVRATRAEQQVIRERDQVLVEKQQKVTALSDARHNQRTAQERLAAGLLAAGDAALALGRSDARDSYFESWQISKELGLSELKATTGLLASYAEQPPPLVGNDGRNAGVGGFEGHSRGSLTVAFSPDGKSAASASSGGVVNYWNVASGTMIRSYSLGDQKPYQVAFSSDGRSFLAVGNDNKLQLWDLTTGKQLRTFGSHDATVRAVAMSADGQRAVSGSDDKTIRLWDVSTGTELRHFNFSNVMDYVDCLAISPDAKRMVAGGQPHAIGIWDAETGELVRQFSDGSDSAVTSLAYLPDGKTALSSNLTCGISLWDMEAGIAIRTFPGNLAAVRKVALSPDGKFALSVGHDKTVRVWETATAKPVAVWNGHLDGVTSASFSPDGRFVLSGDQGGAIKLWGLHTDSEIPALRGHTARVVTLDAAVNEGTVLSGSFDKTIRLWDVATGMPIRSISTGDSAVYDVALAASGRMALSAHGNGKLALWDIRTATRIREFVVSNGIVSTVAFTPDGESALASNAVGELTLWNLQTGEAIRKFAGHSKNVANASISPDGRTALSASADGTIKLWEIASGQAIHTFTGHRHWVHQVAFSPDDRAFASGGWDGQCGLWDLATGKNIRFVEASRDIVLGVVFSTDGKILFTCSLDGNVGIWDVVNGEHVRNIRRHGDGVTSLVVSTTSGALLSASRDNLIRRWEWDRPARYREFALSIPKARAALARDPHNSEALAVFAKWYAFRGVHDWAAEFFEKSRSADADVPSLDLARCYWQLGRRDDAAREFRKAIERQEDSADYLELCLSSVTVFDATSHSTSSIETPNPADKISP